MSTAHTGEAVHSSNEAVHPSEAALPTSEAARIESLDVVRGFALLGILLLNIIGFALPSALYLVPTDASGNNLDLMTWLVFEVGAEGAMRCLFSILFGAGVALFLNPKSGKTGKSAKLHYRRTFWLLIFGLVDILGLLWGGDILLVYALAGFILYWVRNVSASRLFAGSIALILLMSLQYGAFNNLMNTSKVAAEKLATLPVDEQPEELVQLAIIYSDMVVANRPSVEEVAEEVESRGASYSSAFAYTLDGFVETVSIVIPVFWLWDALAMMLLGMALYKYGILQGDRGIKFYRHLMMGGFAVGLAINLFEAYRAYSSGFAVLETFPYMQWTYHFGRLGMAMGWFGLLMVLIKADLGKALRKRLGAVGRMALTNYLSHSVICMILFTGAGFGLVGEFSRFEIYLFVAGIWLFALWFSPWWLQRYFFGPVEWLWRGLTYGKFSSNRRS